MNSGRLYGRAARALSLGLALALTLLVTSCPRLFAHSTSELPHGLLALLMLGICGAYVHGVGFVPQQRWLRVLLGPFAAWPLLGVAGLMLALR